MELTGSSLITYSLGLVAIAAAIYVCFGRKILQVAIALFVEFFALSGIFLSLGSEYLALVSVLIGVLAAVIVLSFSSVIVGVLRDPTLEERSRGGSLAARWAGFALGIGIGALFSVAFMNMPYMSSRVSNSGSSATTLGKTLLGEHTIVFELAGITGLAMIMGMGILLRSRRGGSSDA